MWEEMDSCSVPLAATTLKMCGRYANAQPPRQFTAAVRDRLRRRDRVQRGEDNAESSKAAQQEDASQSKDTHSDDADFIVSRVEEGDYHPTHNVSPSSRAPILRLEKPVPLPLDGEVNEVPKEGNDLIIECMRWGLLPARTTSIPHGVDALRTINARDDSVMSGQSMWTPLLKKGKRCIVFCQGFYEWLKKPDGTRIAHFCGMEDEGNGRVDVHGKQRALMPMAGLYEQCTIDGQPFLSFTIITTESNKQLNFLVSNLFRR
jgi:putative SOS response-associated peptidase YedK